MSARDFDLLRRGQATLCANILDGPRRPLRGICPSPNVYLGIWSRDAAFHAMAVARWDGQLAREQIQIFLDRQTPTGGFIDVVYQDGNKVENFGTPRVMPWACMIVHRRRPDLGFPKAGWCDQNEDTFWESYDSKNGKGPGTRHYGWTGGWLIEFVLNWDSAKDP